MRKTIIAPVGDHLDDLFVGVREFPTEKVILLCPKERYDEALGARDSLKKFKIPTKIVDIKSAIWEEIFKAVSKIRKYEQGDLMINVSTGDRESRCAATSAAFVNGIKAFSVHDDMVMMLPVLKFSYYTLLTDKKMGILKVIYKDKDCCASLEDLAKKTKMSMPLVSYHINGTLKSEGLKQMGLVETEEKSRKTKIKLTMLGKMIIEGYIQ